jgi:hypothetical protein
VKHGRAAAFSIIGSRPHESEQFAPSADGRRRLSRRVAARQVHAEHFQSTIVTAEADDVAIAKPCEWSIA